MSDLTYEQEQNQKVLRLVSRGIPYDEAVALVQQASLSQAPQFQNPQAFSWVGPLAQRYQTEMMLGVDGPAGQAIRGLALNVQGMSNAQIMSLAYKNVVEPVGKLLGLKSPANLIGATVGMQGLDWSTMIGPQMHKAVDYFHHLSTLSADEQYRFEKATGIATAVGWLSDWAGFALGPLAKPLKGLYEATGRAGALTVQLANNLAEKAPGLVRPMIWARTVAAPIATENLIEGGFLTLREHAVRKQAGGPGVFDQGVGEVARVWGAQAAQDFALGTALNLAAPLWHSLRRFFAGGEYSRAAVREAPEVDIAMDALLRGRLNYDQVARLSPRVRDSMQFQIDILNTAAHDVASFNTDPWKKTQLAGHFVGLQAVEEGPNSYRVFLPGRTGEVGRNLRSIRDVRAAIATQAERAIKETEKHGQPIDDLLNRIGWILPYKRTADEVHRAFDIAPPRGVNPERWKSPAVRREVASDEVWRLEGRGAQVLRIDQPGPMSPDGVVDAARGEWGVALVRNPATPEELAKAQLTTDPVGTLIENNFDSIVHPDGGVSLLFPEQQIKQFGNVSRTGTRIKAKTTFEALKMDRLRENARANVVMQASQVSGELTTSHIQQLIRTATKGVDHPVKRIIIQRAETMGIEALEPEGTIRLSVPETIDTPAQRWDLARTIARAVGLPEGAPRAWQSPFEDVRNTESWTQWVAGELGINLTKTADNRFVMGTVPGAGTPALVPSQPMTLEETLQRLVSRTVTESSLKADLARRGIRLRPAGGGLPGSVTEPLFEASGKGLKEPVRGTVWELTQMLGSRKLDMRFAPRAVQVIESGPVRFEAGALYGPRHQIMRILDRFGPADLPPPAGLVRDPAVGWVVNLPELGTQRVFGDELGAAKDFATNWQRLDHLMDEATRKGFYVSVEGRGLVFATPQGQRFVAGNAAEAAQILKRVPDPSGAPPLLRGVQDLPQSLDMYHERLPGVNPYSMLAPGTRPHYVFPEGARRYGSMDVVRAHMGTFESWAEKFFGRVGMNRMLQGYRDIRDGVQMYLREKRVVEAELRKAFSLPGGKVISKQRRRAIYYWMGAQNNDELAAKLAEFKLDPLSGEELQIVERLRKVLGRNEREGLFLHLGIDGHKFVWNYMSRFRADMSDPAFRKLLAMEEEAGEFLRKRLGPDVPSELKWMGEEMRTSDLMKFAVEDDALEVALRYSDWGLKVKNLRHPWRNFAHDLAQAHKSGALPDEAFVRINHFRDLIMGSGETLDEKNINLWATGVAKALGLRGKDSAGYVDFVKSMFAMQYGSGLGLRAWPVARNMLQVQLVGVRLGWQPMMEGIELLGGKSRIVGGIELRSGEELIHELKRTQVIPGEGPFVHRVLDVEGILGRLTRFSLKGFRASDEVTRAVAYSAFKSHFARAWEMRLAGMSERAFEEASGLSMMDPSIRLRVKTAIDRGTPGEAAEIYAAQGVSDTNFNYQGSEQPGFFTSGIIGRMAGQYGAYSAGYRALLSKMFRYGSPAQRVGQAARLVASGVGLYAFFRQIGIDTHWDFIPFAPSLFGGGPYYHLVSTAFSSLNPGSSGQQARSDIEQLLSPVRGLTSKVNLNPEALTSGELLDPDVELKPNYPGMAPGGLHLHYLKKFVEFRDQGDYWRAWLSLMGAPVVPVD